MVFVFLTKFGNVARYAPNEKQRCIVIFSFFTEINDSQKINSSTNMV